MIRTVFYTLGCKLNQCESEALASSFKSRGFSVSSSPQEADIFIVNSCTVTSKAEQKARRMIRKFSRENPLSVIFVTGCYAQLNGDDISALAENVYVIPLDLKHTIMDLPEIIMDGLNNGMSLNESAQMFVKGEIPPVHDFDRFKFIGSTHTIHTRAYLKIQDGCNNNCAYCRVQIARGKSVSLDLKEAVKRAVDLENEGYREIVLTGVNISDYRNPGKGEEDLASLVHALTANLKSSRIRLSSLEPDNITVRLAEAVSHPNVTPHFHIPVQSGSNRVIEKINRHYTAEQVTEAVGLLRSAKDDPFIAADIIVGLPYEQDEDFKATYDLVQDISFSQVHIFPYSPRPGTELYTVPIHVPERTARERAGKLHELATSLYRAYVNRWQGQEVEVLLEQRGGTDGNAEWMGLSGNYLHTMVEDVPGGDENRGRIIRAVISSVQEGIVSKFLKFL